MNRRKALMGAAIVEALCALGMGILGTAVLASGASSITRALDVLGGAYATMVVSYMHVKLGYYRFWRKPVMEPRVYGKPTKGAVLAVEILCKNVAGMLQRLIKDGKPDSVPDDEWRDYLGTLEAFRVGTAETLEQMRAAAKQ